MIDKSVIRKELKQIRNNICDKDKKSLIISNKLYDVVKEHNPIGLYSAMPDEVNLDTLIIRLLDEGRRVALPKIVGNDIKFYYINSITELKKCGKYNIREPQNNNCADGEIEVLIVPGLGFDYKNMRLGFGKGYYDRYLSKYKGISYGACFEEQYVEELPINEYDIPVDGVVTDGA